MAASSAPQIRAALRASVREPFAPSAMAPGSIVAGGPIRATAPCSWSVEMSSGMGVRWARPARWMPLERAAIWRGSWVLCAQAK